MILKLLLCEWPGLLLSNLVVPYETTRITGAPRCTWDLYFVAASFNFPCSMIQIPMYSEDKKSNKCNHSYNYIFSTLHRCFSLLHSMYLWQQCSLTPTPSAVLRMCIVSHPLAPYAHLALTIQSTVPHSLSMHMKLNCILPPTPLWCSYQVTIFLIGM